MGSAASGLFQKLGFENEWTLIRLAVHVMVAVVIDQANAFDLGAFLMTVEEPLTFRSLTSSTLSPSASGVPLASLMMRGRCLHRQWFLHGPTIHGRNRGRSADRHRVGVVQAALGARGQSRRAQGFLSK
jgi:hypothetical protein